MDRCCQRASSTPNADHTDQVVGVVGRMGKGRGICAGCRRERSLVTRGLCHTCYHRTREKEACCGCGRLTVPVGRTAEGAWCQTCTNRRRAEPCSRCGRTGRVAARRDGAPVCSRCWQAERRVPQPCSRCGRVLKATKNTAEGRVCYTCHRATLPREPCCQCGKVVLAAAHTAKGACGAASIIWLNHARDAGAPRRSRSVATTVGRCARRATSVTTRDHCADAWTAARTNRSAGSPTMVRCARSVTIGAHRSCCVRAAANDARSAS